MAPPPAPIEPDGAAPAARRRQLHALRQQLRAAFGAAATAAPLSTLATGWPALDDRLVGGGLPRGRLTALAGAGATGLLHRLVARVTRAGTVAWLDPQERLDATALAAAGADLAEVLVIRPPSERTLLRTVAVLQRTGAVDLVVVDAPQRRGAAQQRLATLARLGPAGLLVLDADAAIDQAAGDHGRLASVAVADLWLVVARIVWQQDAVGLHGGELAVTIVRQRGGRDGERLTLGLTFPQPLPPLDGLPDRWVPAGADRSARERHGTG